MSRLLSTYGVWSPEKRRRGGVTKAKLALGVGPENPDAARFGGHEQEVWALQLCGKHHLDASRSKKYDHNLNII